MTPAERRFFYEILDPVLTYYWTWHRDTLAGEGSKGKQVPRYDLGKGGVTDYHFDAHIAGEHSLVLDYLHNDETRVGWIDLDDNYVKGRVVEVSKEIARLGLPLIAFESKSFGAHLGAICDKRVSVERMHDLLIECAKTLNLKPTTDYQLFPHKTPSSDGRGNGINVPYFGSWRWAYFEGRRVSLDQFVNETFNYIVIKDLSYWIEKVRTGIEIEVVPDFENAPPCVRSILEGVEEGSRDNAIMHAGAWLRDNAGDDWTDKLFDIAAKCRPHPFPASEVARKIASLSKQGEDGYITRMLCTRPEFPALCGGKCKFKGPRREGIEIDRVTQFLGPQSHCKVWFNDFAEPVVLPALQLQNPKAFAGAVLCQLGQIIAAPDARDWSKMLATLNADGERWVMERQAFDATDQGTIIEALKKWVAYGCLTEAKAANITREEKPAWFDGQLIVKGAHFMAHLGRKHRSIRPDAVWPALVEVPDSLAFYQPGSRATERRLKLPSLKTDSYWCLPLRVKTKHDPDGWFVLPSDGEPV